MSEKLELIPVEDIKVTKGMTVDAMLRAMGRAGGFTAQKLADATDIAEAMVKKEGCLRILSFPACIIATGTRGVIIDLVRNGMIPQPFSSMSKLLPSFQPNETKDNNADIPSLDYGICG